MVSRDGSRNGAGSVLGSMSRMQSPNRPKATSQPAAERSRFGREFRTAIRASPFLDGAGSRMLGVASALFGHRTDFQTRKQISPVFIVGSGRSGNTLVRRILIASGAIHIPPETYVLSRVISTFRRYPFLPWPNLVDLVLASFEYHAEFEYFSVSLRPLALELRGLPLADRSLATIIDAFYRFHAQSCDAITDRWGDKTPLNSYAMDRLSKLFPHARFVHVLRDGVDVVESYLRSGLIDSSTDAAIRWSSSVSAVRRFSQAHPSSCIEVRYEQLVRDTETVVASLESFLELDLTATARQPLMRDVEAHEHHATSRDPITEARIGSGRRNLSMDTLQHLDWSIGNLLEQVGYDRPIPRHV
jgi:protein-tyrosine sulfotransferase